MATWLIFANMGDLPTGLEHFQENACPCGGRGGIRFSVRKCDMQKSAAFAAACGCCRGRLPDFPGEGDRNPLRRGIDGTACGVSPLTPVRRSGHLGSKMAAGEN